MKIKISKEIIKKIKIIFFVYSSTIRLNMVFHVKNTIKHIKIEMKKKSNKHFILLRHVIYE